MDRIEALTDMRDWLADLINADQGAITGGFDVVQKEVDQTGAAFIVKSDSEGFEYQVFIRKIK